MILALYEHPNGVEAPTGNVVLYDLARNEARFGGGTGDGHTLLWELAEHERSTPKVAARVELEGSAEWLMRCDRVDFPPGGVAYRHTHPGPGIRCLLTGSIRIESKGRTTTYGPLEAWFESGPEPVFAAASESEPTAFVRVMLLPREWVGRRTIRYVDPEDEDKPKTQRATVFVDQPIAL